MNTNLSKLFDQVDNAVQRFTDTASWWQGFLVNLIYCAIMLALLAATFLVPAFIALSLYDLWHHLLK